MSDRKDEALKEMAANRGCRLQKSRRRKPGGDFGLYGLKDAKTGDEVMGFGEKGLTATADEIEAFLRGDSLAGWKSSLSSGPPRKKAGKEESRKKSAKQVRPKSPKAAPKPKKLVIRDARPKEAEAIAALMATLGYDVTVPDVRRRLAMARKRGEPTLVAEEKDIVGCLSWHVTPVLHRPRPVGRVTMMVVAESARGRGIGSALLLEAEKRLAREGCGLIEVTSNMKRMRAHDFYKRLGFERTSYRFMKKIGD